MRKSTLPSDKPAPPFPFAGIICLLMGGLLLFSGGFRWGAILIAFAIFWAIFALWLKKKQS
jgi:hypothetical protein